MNQQHTLLLHLTQEPHITQLQAIAVHRVYNIKGRINDLRKEGWEIETAYHTDRTGKRYARYSLADHQKPLATAFIHHQYGRKAA
jgi:hypothetical protein